MTMNPRFGRLLRAMGQRQPLDGFDQEIEALKYHLAVAVQHGFSPESVAAVHEQLARMETILGYGPRR